MYKLYFIKEFFENKKRILISLIVMLILIIIILVFLIINKKSSKDIKESIEIETKVEKVETEKNIEKKEELCTVKVDIKGYINNPGLYEVECSKRVNDVIELAGGLKKNADTTVLNLGKKVFDQMVIIVYSNEDVLSFNETRKKEIEKDEKCLNKEIIKNDACITKEDRIESSFSISSESVKEIDDTKKLISLNSANKEELMTLPGIGESKALAIIAYREENGLFNNTEELKNIKGIGDKMFEKIKDYITV